MRISDWSSDVCSSDLPVELKDVIERDPNYVIGISYPPNINQYPGLAAELQRYADAARSELMQAVDGLAGEKPSAPYDLSLAFNMLAETPQVVTVAANGSSYTGGAHGNPLAARFVWLPQRNELLQAPPIGRAHVCTPVTNAHPVSP